jgi:cell division transport system ATP-binding protein
MIKFEGVSKYYNNDRPSLHGVDLKIKAGELVTLTGHSGAGKTTIIRMLLGDERPTEGKISFHGDDVHRISNSALPRHRRRIGTVFQDFKLLPHKTAHENVCFAMEVAGRSDYDIQTDVPHMLELVNLHEKIHQFPHQLSGGEQQRLAIARAIVNQPELVIADEPTGNLDHQATYDIVQILKKLHELGKTVIIATHDMGIVDYLDSRVVRLENGRVVEDTGSR